MKKQISYITPGQTAKALILIYLTFSVPIVILGALVAAVQSGIASGGMSSTSLANIVLAFFSALILNALIGFALLWIACHAYNWVASRFGGIEIALTDAPEDEDEDDD
jgi:hypothetical protein